MAQSAGDTWHIFQDDEWCQKSSQIFYFIYLFFPSCPKNKQKKVSKSLTFKILRCNHFWILPPPISLFPTVFWLQSKRPPYLIAYWVGSLYRRALHYSLDTVHVTGSITVTISILKWQGQFPAFSRILLCNLIANASPVSAPLAFISMLPTPPPPLGTILLFLVKSLPFALPSSFPLLPSLPFQLCVKNKLSVTWGAGVLLVMKILLTGQQKQWGVWVTCELCRPLFNSCLSINKALHALGRSWDASACLCILHVYACVSECKS